MKILVTGGCGFIGSHTVVELLNNNYEVIVIDNFSNSKREVVDRIKEITKKEFKLYEEDVCNEIALENIFKENKIDTVIHFAAYKSVNESLEKPLEYYSNNINGVLTLCKVMKKHSVKNIVFSSSASVYGVPEKLPIKEDAPVSNATNPYGQSKIIAERILNDLYNSDNSFNIAILRYFNPIGSHSSGLIGEDPNGIPNDLLPYVSRVAIGKLECLSIFGSDYDTKDGTGVRDYIHVVDLAKGHIKAIEWVSKNKGLDIFNLGTGRGYSVLEIVNAYETVNHVKVPYKLVERREGDVASSYADATHAKEVLNWQTELNIDDMVKDSYNYIKMNNN